MKKPAEFFVTSDGVENYPYRDADKPNLNWRPTDKENPLLKTGRTDADRTQSALFLSNLKKDLEGYKNWLEPRMDPYRKEKVKMLANADKIVEACEKLEEIVDTFNLIAKKLFEASEADDAESFRQYRGQLVALFASVSEHNKRVKMRQSIPRFLSPARTFAAIKYEYIQAYRDKTIKHERWMNMSPAQREAARKTSQRMRMAWGM